MTALRHLTPRRGKTVTPAAQTSGRHHRIFGWFAQLFTRGGGLFAGDQKILPRNKQMLFTVHFMAGCPLKISGSAAPILGGHHLNFGRACPGLN
jgi:hypothetical protein